MTNWLIGIVIFVSILAILDYSDKQQSRKYDTTNYNNSYSTKTTYDKSQMLLLYAEMVHTVIVQIGVALAHIMVV